MSLAWAKQNHRKKGEAKNSERKGVGAGGSQSLLVLRAGSIGAGARGKDRYGVEGSLTGG